MAKYKAKRKKTPREQVRDEAKKINWKLILITLISTVVIFAVYQIAMHFMFGPLIYIYAGIALVCGICFGILNKGFSGKKPVIEDLPEEWEDDRKQEVLAKELKRRKTAKIFLIPLIGIMLTFAFDLVYLFYISPLIG